MILWNAIIAILGKHDRTMLSCGLVGYCGSSVADKSLLKILMMYNLDRGKDATGWLINNEITKDTTSVAKFMAEHELDVSEYDDNFTFIGHARASSSGAAKNKNHAHPFGRWEGGHEKEDPDLALAMNGTVNNMFEIAKDFGETFTYHTNSDTEVISQIIANLGEDNFVEFLQKYEGAATLLFSFLKEPNTLYIYKDIQRPLYYYIPHDESIYISSMEESLLAIGADLKSVIKFEDTHFYKIENGIIVKSEKVTRPKAKIYIGYEGGYYSGYQGGGNSTFPNQGRLPLSNINIDSDNIESVISKLISNKKDCSISYAMDKYRRNGHAIHGDFILSKDGQIVYGDTTKGNPYFFIDGYMLKNKQSYDGLKAKLDNSKSSIVNFPKSHIVEFLRYPIVTTIEKKLHIVMPDHFVEEYFPQKVKGSTIKYTPEFTDIEISLEFIDEVIEVTKKYLAEITKVEQKINKPCAVSDHDRCLSIVKNFDKQKNFIKLDSLLCENDIEYEDIINEFKSTFWKVNNYPTINKYFFEDIFLKHMVSNSVIDFNKADDYIKELNRKNSTFPFNPEDLKFVNNIIKSYREANNSNNNAKVLDGLSIKEKLNLVDGAFNDFTKEDIYDSILQSSTYYTNEMFKSEVVETTHKTLGEFSYEWLGDIEPFEAKASSEFYDAVLVALKELGIISLDNFFEAMCKPYKYKVQAIKQHYNDYVCQLNSEILDADQVEKNIEDMFLGVKQSIKMVSDEIKISSVVTTRMEKIDNMMILLEKLIQKEEIKVELNENRK